MVLLGALPPYCSTIPCPGPHGAASFPRGIFNHLIKLIRWFSARVVGGARDTVHFLLRLFSRPTELFRWFSSARLVEKGPSVDRPMQGQRKTLRRALLIGIDRLSPEKPVRNTIEENGDQGAASNGAVGRHKALRGPQKDAWDLSRLLIDVYGYDEGEITVLIDDDIPGNMQPTKDNVIQQMKDLVQDAAKGDQFFFHFAGHSTQAEATNDATEDDGKDEFIITCDGQLVIDDDLRKHLLSPLPAGSSLVAVLDSCHSGTLLDLPHIRCNRVYVPWVSKVESPSSTLTTPLSSDSLVVESPVGATFPEWCLTPHSQVPQSMFCTGWCREEQPLTLQDGRPPVEADVIALSAAKDGQRSWEDKEGKSMTQALIRILRENSNPSLENLLTLVSHELHKSYLELHDKARAYIDKVRIANQKRRQMGQASRRAATVETDNFQDPQISSPQPLDMKRAWAL